jgi:hypothetical protein
MFLFALAILQDGLVAELDTAAKSRDVAAFVRRLAPGQELAARHLQILKTNGAYDVGRLGWRAVGNENNIVLTTPLTSEDVGDYVFEIESGRLRYIPETNDLGVRVRKHDLTARFDIPSKKAFLTDEVTFRSTGNGKWLFRLSPCYTVKSVTMNGEVVPYTQLGGVVLFQNRPGSEFTYKIAYEGIVYLPQYAGSISNTEVSLTNDYWYPMIARKPSPYDLTVTVPRGWIAVGQGVRTSVTEQGDAVTSRYEMKLPVVYYSFGAGTYKSVEVPINGKTYRAWSPRLSERAMDTTARLYAPIVEYFESVFGKFPFNGYGALDSPAYGGGALEAYSHATWGGGLPMEDTHEAAHTYWGGLINNSYLEDFWNESFAVFCEGLYSRNVKIGDSRSRRLAFVSDSNPADDYAAHPISGGGAFAGGVASSLGYGKGAKVLQMMEQMVGTDAMISTMRSWLQTVSPYETATWQDFRKHAIAKNPDSSLEQFFKDWLDQTGWADLRLTGAKHGAGKVQLQLQISEAPKLVPIDVLLSYAGGRQVFSKIVVREAGVYTVQSVEKPTLVVLDPWNKVLRRRARTEIPDSIRSLQSRSRITDSKVDWYGEVWQLSNRNEIPVDPNGATIIGHPDTLPGMKALCEKAGFRVSGNRLTFGSRSVDLERGGAMAIVDLGGGKRCVIGLGKMRCRPDTGRARLALLDEFGRMTFGITEPMTRGPLTTQL